MTKTIFLLFAVMLCFLQPGRAQEWLIPEDQKNIENPSPYNLSNVQKGKELYLNNCKSCHGDAGKNNGLPLVPPPPDVTSEQMQANSEGELYYKITHGLGGMPQFETTLSEDDRWRLVNYISNYNPANTPVLVEAPPREAKLMASVNETKKLVEIFAEVENEDGHFVSLAETPVNISVQRAFGNLPLSTVLTDDEGHAEFAVPETLIGDESGMATIVVELEDNFTNGQFVIDAAQIGQPKPLPKLIRKGVLWSTNDNVPMWLLLSYIGAVLGAWSTIGYVAFQIFKIWRIGKQ